MNKKILNNKQFLELIASKEGDVRGPLEVRGDITVDKTDYPNLVRISITEATFMGMLSIKKFYGPISLAEVHAAGGLYVEESDGSGVSILSVRARWIVFRRNKFLRACLVDIQTDNLDLSGLDLSECLRIDHIQTENVELIHFSTQNTIKVSKVVTEDPLIARQFELAGIPVFMPTGAVRNWMAAKSSQNEAAEGLGFVTT